MSQIYVFDELVDEIIQTKKIKDSGGHIGIPYPFESLNNDLGGIEKDCVVGITANSGVSKSKFTRFVYIYNVYKFYKKTGYPVQIIYFPLEDSHKDVLCNMICFYLKEKYDMYITAQHIRQIGKYNLDNFTINKIKEARGYFSDLYDILKIVEDAPTVSEMFKICTAWAEKNGDIKYKQDAEGNKIVSSYKSKTNIHTIVIIDNLSNVLKEKKYNSKHEALGDLVAGVCRTILAKIFKFTVVVVQQQGQAKERVQMNQNGKHMYEKYEPSLGDLAENLETQRAFHLAFGLFSPDRYGLESYWGYDIKILGGFFRSLKVLKSNRSGVEYKITPLWFEGNSETYDELPRPPEMAKNGDPVGEPSDELMKFYEKANQIRGRRKSAHQLKLVE